MRVNPLQQEIPVIDVCNLANDVMEEFEKGKLALSKEAGSYEVLSFAFGALIGRVLQRSNDRAWADRSVDSARHLLGARDTAAVAAANGNGNPKSQFRCPTKNVFAKLNVKGKCSACGRKHELVRA